MQVEIIVYGLMGDRKIEVGPPVKICHYPTMIIRKVGTAPYKSSKENTRAPTRCTAADIDTYPLTGRLILRATLDIIVCWMLIFFFLNLNTVF